MALSWSRVLAAAKRISLQKAHYSSGRLISSDSSNLNPLFHRLLQEPSSSIKTLLNSHDTSFLGSSQIPWKSIFAFLRSSSWPKKAQLVLEWRLEKLSKENERDPDCYIDLICLCGELQNIPLAMRVFTAMESEGVKPTVTVFNSLLEACLSSRNMTTAFSIFEVMQNSENFKPNSDTFDSFILTYSKLRDVDAMKSWYSAKREFGFSANLRTYESLIHGSVKSKAHEFADQCFKEMMVSGIVPNSIILESMLEGLCNRRSLDEVNKFLNTVLDHGWEINRNFVDKFIGLCFESGKVEDMEELLAKLNKTNQTSDVVSRVYCGITRMYAMANRLDEVEYFVTKLLKQGQTFDCAEEVENIICAYLWGEAYDKLEFFIHCIKDNYMFTE